MQVPSGQLQYRIGVMVRHLQDVLAHATADRHSIVSCEVQVRCWIPDVLVVLCCQYVFSVSSLFASSTRCCIAVNECRSSLPTTYVG